MIAGIVIGGGEVGHVSAFAVWMNPRVSAIMGTTDQVRVASPSQNSYGSIVGLGRTPPLC